MNTSLNIRLAALIDRDRHVHAARNRRLRSAAASKEKTKGKVEHIRASSDLRSEADRFERLPSQIGI